METAVKEKLRSTLEKLKQQARADEDEQFAKVLDKKLKEINSLSTGSPVVSSGDIFPRDPKFGPLMDPHTEMAVTNDLFFFKQMALDVIFHPDLYDKILAGYWNLQRSSHLTT